MLTIALSLMLASFAFGASAAVSAAKGPGMSYLDTNKILTVSQLRRGMKGYGLTVFQGAKIEKFDVEILGILANANNGRDYILARFTGGPLSVRGMGVAHGMSGSPVYINGKLVGAVSAAMEWAREPIGMITPITDMIESLDDNLPKRPSGYSSITRSSTSPPRWAAELTTRSSSTARIAPHRTLMMEPCTSPRLRCP